MPRLQPPLLSAYPGGRAIRRCPQCGLRVAGDQPCPECHLRPTAAYRLELMLRRRLRGVLIKAACVLLVLAALLAGWSHVGGAGVERRPPIVHRSA